MYGEVMLLQLTAHFAQQGPCVVLERTTKEKDRKGVGRAKGRNTAIDKTDHFKIRYHTWWFLPR